MANKIITPRSIYAAKLREFGEFAWGDEAAFAHRGCWRDFFRARMGPAYDGRIIFEIGCFNASLLTRVAKKHPRTAFIGLDWKCKAIYDAAASVSKMGLKNIALLRGRGQDIRHIFSSAEVDEAWVFHPDPCESEVEQKNRLIAEPFLLNLHDVLRDGNASLCLKTDHPGYHEWVLGIFGLLSPDGVGSGADPSSARAAVVERFIVSMNSSNFWNDPAALRHTAARAFSGEVSLFENRFIRRKQPIHYFEIRKR